MMPREAAGCVSPRHQVPARPHLGSAGAAVAAGAGVGCVRAPGFGPRPRPALMLPSRLQAGSGAPITCCLREQESSN